MTLYAAANAFAEDWVFVEDISGNAQGGVIIRYPDLAELRAQSLSRQLSYHGWSSVLVPIPSSQAAFNEPIPTAEPIIFIKDQHGQHNLVLVTLGDAWDPELALQEFENDDGDLERPIQAVVMVDVPGEINPTPNIPTLDISTTIQPVFGFDRRKQLARRDGIESSQSVELRYSTRKQPETSREDFLTRRIRSWLHHNARGMEITEVEQ